MSNKCVTFQNDNVCVIATLIKKQIEMKFYTNGLLLTSYFSSNEINPEHMLYKVEDAYRLYYQMSTGNISDIKYQINGSEECIVWLYYETGMVLKYITEKFTTVPLSNKEFEQIKFIFSSTKNEANEKVNELKETTNYTKKELLKLVNRLN